MLKKIGIAIVVVLVVIQFFGGDKNDATTRDVTQFITETQPSTDVKNILGANCFDCHSNKTTYPWYANIAPLSFWINHHVEEGREHLDFSAWSNYDSKRKKHKLDELIEEVEEDKMPLESYEKLHGELSEADQELLINWAKKAMANYMESYQKQIKNY